MCSSAHVKVDSIYSLYALVKIVAEIVEQASFLDTLRQGRRKVKEITK